MPSGKSVVQYVFPLSPSPQGEGWGEVLSLQQRVLSRIFTGFPFIKPSERKARYQNRCKDNKTSQRFVRKYAINISFYQQ